MIISISAAVVLTLVWLAALPDLRHPTSWLNQRLARLGAVATTGAVMGFAVVLLMLSPIGRALGAGALATLRLILVGLGLSAGVLALCLMRVVDLLLARARRATPPPAPSGGPAL